MWLVSTSFKSSRELMNLDITLLPKEWHFANYSDAWQQQGLVLSAWNSTIVAVCTTVLVIVLSLPAAYAFSRFRGALRAAGTVWILVSQVFPVILIIVPLFLILRDTNLVNTLPGLILVYTTYTMPFALWMLQGFAAAIPIELQEAASVDGCLALADAAQRRLPAARARHRRHRHVLVRVGVERVLLRPRAHADH